MTTPVTLPRLQVEVGGQPVSADQLRGLLDIRVQQRLSMPSVCEIAFLDPRSSLDGTPLAQIGTRLRVGMPDADCDLFAGEITAVEFIYPPSGPREVRVRAYDVLNKLSRQQSVRTFVQATLAEVAQQLCAGVSLSVQVHLDDPPWERVIQHEQTDLELLAELAERRGAYFFLRDDALHLAPLSGVGDAVALKLGRSLLDARFTRNDIAACERVETVGWDTWMVQAHKASAQTARSAAAAAADAGSGSGFERILVNRPVRDEDEAAAGAQAEFDLREAARARLQGRAEGNPALRPGTPVRVEGVDAALTGPYLLTSVNHVLTPQSGFVSEIDTLPARPPPRSRGISVTLGVVASTDDPQSLGRVQLALPAFGDITTDWVQTLSPWAGAGKGFMSQADVNDTVLFLFFDADPGQGIALGSVYGSGGPPSGWENSSKGQRYLLITPGGQKLSLDDSGSRLRLENKGGSFVELSPDLVMLHSTAKLTIQAPGQPVVIAGKTIDFQEI